MLRTALLVAAVLAQYAVATVPAPVNMGTKGGNEGCNPDLSANDCSPTPDQYGYLMCDTSQPQGSFQGTCKREEGGRCNLNSDCGQCFTGSMTCTGSTYQPGDGPDSPNFGSGHCCPNGKTYCPLVQTCSVICPSNPVYPSRKKVRRNTQLVLGEDGLTGSCPVGENMCRDGRKHLCVNFMSDVEHCGGCSEFGEGQDCTRIKGAGTVICDNGKCNVLKCKPAFKFNPHVFDPNERCVSKQKTFRKADALKEIDLTSLELPIVEPVIAFEISEIPELDLP